MLSRHLIDLDDLSIHDLHSILKLAHEIKERPGDILVFIRIKSLPLYELSTRLQMSPFKRSMLRLDWTNHWLRQSL